MGGREGGRAEAVERGVGKGGGGERRWREVEREGGRWRGREGGGEGSSIVSTDNDFAPHDHDSQLISLMIQ